MTFTVESLPLPIPCVSALKLNSHNRLCRIALSTHHASNSSQRFSNLSLPQGRSNFIHDPRTWMHPISDDDEDGDEKEEDRSLDLLVRFIQNVFKKVSKRARKAVRSVLPFPISNHLVRFSVNGILMLAFLWILKAFLEVLCTLGSAVFVSILLIRGIWSGVRFLQENRHQKMDELDMQNAWNWNGVQPVT
ncbi:hypothetical protein Fmac_003531 [Flemingia macrophylla]|uniref:Uncharacterized protein n=1 Tax=Flemingia macrophylla TaxID=520843 RepID=A0ABD1NNN5_9FABA